MLIVKYCPDGELFPDHIADKLVKNKINEYLVKYEPYDKNMIIKVANELAFNYFVLFTMQGLIDYDDIDIYYNERHCMVDKYLGVKYRDENDAEEGLFAQCLNEILKIGFDNLKKDRSKKGE